MDHYQQCLKDKASRSIKQLKHALEVKSSYLTMNEKSSEPVCNTLNEECNELDVTNGELQHSPAVNQLKALLRKQDLEHEDSMGKQTRNLTPEGHSLSAIDDLVPIINDQSEYINHLEAEVKFCKEELSGIKHRVNLVVLENDNLHKQLKSRVQEAGLNARTLAESSDAQRLHQEKTDILESQVMYLRKDLADSQKQCEELHCQLKNSNFETQTRNSTNVNALCLKCTSESVFTQKQANIHKTTIEKLTRERDELMDALVSLRKYQISCQEWELKPYNQVKQAVEMTEKANLEKSMALENCKQLKSEIERKNARLEQEIAIQFEKMSSEKKVMQEEATKERQELVTKISSLTQKIADLGSDIEKVTREKNTAVKQQDEFQRKLSLQEEEASKVYGEIRFQLNQIKIQKDEAEKEHKEYRVKIQKALEIKDQEIVKLELQLTKNKQCLEQAQQDASRAKDECLRLTELLGNAEHQLHLTRLEKDDIQQRLSSELRSVAFQAQKCEQELKQKMQQMEAQHDQTVNEMDSLMISQNVLISKLKKECSLLAKQLELITAKKRSGTQYILHENACIHDRLQKVLNRNNELEDQCIQHGAMHERMKARLNQLDNHCKNSALRIVDLLNKQNEQMQEKQMCTE